MTELLRLLQALSHFHRSPLLVIVESGSAIPAYIIKVIDSVTGFVLAGGKSSRMGKDKAFMQIFGRTLLAHALELAKAATGSAWICG